MRLLMKWLRPDTIPSPRRKKIPFGKRMQLHLYHYCLSKLAKSYSKFAFSDSVSLVGEPCIRVTHEYRDYSFEAEAKRLRLQIDDSMIVCSGVTSHLTHKKKRPRYHSYFHFEDHLFIEIDGKKISIDHGQGRSFVSTCKGRLKESDSRNLLTKYAFTGSLRVEKVGKPGPTSSFRETNEEEDITEGNSPNRRVPSSDSTESLFSPKKAGGLFGDDPLFEKKPDILDVPLSSPSPSIKNVEGVTIDESF